MLAIRVVDLEPISSSTPFTGARGVITHAIDDAAVAFYDRHGFARCALGARTLHALSGLGLLLLARARLKPASRLQRKPVRPKG